MTIDINKFNDIVEEGKKILFNVGWNDRFDIHVPSSCFTLIAKPSNIAGNGKAYKVLGVNSNHPIYFWLDDTSNCVRFLVDVNTYFDLTNFPLVGWLVSFSKSSGYGMYKPLTEGSTMFCNHVWVNVGFNTIKWVCKKCNVEKSK